VVIAAYNEGPAIGPVVSDLVSRGYPVVVVDDGSQDDTAERACASGAITLRHVINRGQGAALQSGIEYALKMGAQIVVTFDADGQHSPEDLPALISPIADGHADVVLGSRFLNRPDLIPRSRRIVLRAAVLFMRCASGVHLTDAHNGLRAFSRRAAAGIHLQIDRMAHASEIVDQIARSRLKTMEIPVRVRYTPYSRSKGQRSTAAARIALQYLAHKVLN
jgi:glycosyltransferase involved in cell wall biosynthesis